MKLHIIYDYQIKKEVYLTIIFFIILKGYFPENNDLLEIIEKGVDESTNKRTR